MKNEFIVTDEFIELIIQIKKLFESNRIKYWLDEGTLLGVVRDGGIINGDHDFDFSSEYGNISNIINICELLKKKGYYVKYQSGLPYVEDMIQIYLPDDHKMNGIHVDINIYFLNNEKAIRRDFHYPQGKYGRVLVSLAKVLFRKKINYRNSNNYKKMLLLSFVPYPIRRILSYLCMDVYLKYCTTLWQVVPSKYFSNLKQIKLFDSDFYVPADCESYLSYRYGSDWRIPVSNWVWRESPDKAIEYNKLNLVKVIHKHVQF